MDPRQDKVLGHGLRDPQAVVPMRDVPRRALQLPLGKSRIGEVQAGQGLRPAKAGPRRCTPPHVLPPVVEDETKPYSGLLPLSGLHLLDHREEVDLAPAAPHNPQHACLPQARGQEHPCARHVQRRVLEGLHRGLLHPGLPVGVEHLPLELLEELARVLAEAAQGDGRGALWGQVHVLHPQRPHVSLRRYHHPARRPANASSLAKKPRTALSQQLH
eukprot:5317660-Lingulodinium_polyedra.AAC.1